MAYEFIFKVPLELGPFFHRGLNLTNYAVFPRQSFKHGYISTRNDDRPRHFCLICKLFDAYERAHRDHIMRMISHSVCIAYYPQVHLINEFRWLSCLFQRRYSILRRLNISQNFEPLNHYLKKLFCSFYCIPNIVNYELGKNCHRFRLALIYWSDEMTLNLHFLFKESLITW